MLLTYFCSKQINCLWRGNASICGSQHLPQVLYHHQIFPKDVEQCKRDTHFHLPWRFHCGWSSCLELDFCCFHCGPLSRVKSARSVTWNKVIVSFIPVSILIGTGSSVYSLHVHTGLTWNLKSGMHQFSCSIPYYLTTLIFSSQTLSCFRSRWSYIYY